MEGVNIIMQNKLTPEQESFVKIANDNGFTKEITRKDILSLESNNGAKWPRWLVRDSAYRVGRGSYSLPTLGQVVEAESAKDE
jgi:hypothetical protein